MFVRPLRRRHQRGVCWEHRQRARDLHPGHQGDAQDARRRPSLLRKLSPKPGAGSQPPASGTGPRTTLTCCGCMPGANSDQGGCLVRGDAWAGAASARHNAPPTLSQVLKAVRHFIGLFCPVLGPSATPVGATPATPAASAASATSATSYPCVYVSVTVCMASWVGP